MATAKTSEIKIEIAQGSQLPEWEIAARKKRLDNALRKVALRIKGAV